MIPAKGVKKEQQQQQEEVELLTVVSSSSAATIPVTARMGLKKEKEDNDHCKETGDSNYDGPCHGSITVKKEEDENEDQQNSTNTPYTILSTTMVPDQAISCSSSSSNLNSSSRSGEIENNNCITKNNDDDDDDNHRFEKWESGNWCWLDDHNCNDVKEENLKNTTIGCDIDTRLKKEEKEDNSSSFDTTSSGNTADDDTGVKKEEEEKEDNDSRLDANNIRNGDDDTEVKKEKEKDNDSSGFDTTNKNKSKNNCIRTAATVSDDNMKSNTDDYPNNNWTTGNWCWEVLPNLNSDGSSVVGSAAAAIQSIVAVSTGTKNKRKLEQSQDNHKKKSRTIVQNNKNKNNNSMNFNEDTNSQGLHNVDYDDDDDDAENDDDDDNDYDDGNDGESECDESSWNSNIVTKTTKKKRGEIVRYDYEERWNAMYSRLVAYKEQYKNTCVPRSYKADPQLASWVNRQRTNYNKLTAERIHQLNSISFVWNSLDARWTEMYDRLVAYKNQYTNTCVPRSYDADPQLAVWVNKQRQNYNKITADRKHQLNSIGFVWNLLDTFWTEMYERLVVYKNQYKSTRVPRSYKADPQLARWVRTQRGNYNTNSSHLTAERIKLLNSIGFIWNARK